MSSMLDKSLSKQEKTKEATNANVRCSLKILVPDQDVTSSIPARRRREVESFDGKKNTDFHELSNVDPREEGSRLI